MKKQSLILAVILALGSVLSSCGSETTGQTGTTTAADGATATEETDLRFVADELPDLDFVGKTMNVVVGDYFGAYWDDLYAEEATGSRLSDAIYNMRLAVEHRLNVKLNYIREEYNWDSMGDYITKITSQILAGDGDIDLLLSQNNFTSRLGEGQYFADLRNVDHIDLEKPWYNQSVLGNMPDGELPFVLGEFSLGNIKNAYVVYYNSNLKGSLGIDTDLYALVDEGKWTADAMQSLIKDTYSDLNGDTTADPDDRYGLTFGDINKYMGFIKAFDLDIYKKENDGRYRLEYGNERAVNAVDFLQKLVNENENVFPGTGNSDDPTRNISTGGGNYASKAFVEGRSLLSCGLIADASVIVPEFGFDWGLLPYPKFDEAQEDYKCMINGWGACFVAIPDNADVDESGFVAEALGYESYRKVRPEIYERLLKQKLARDERSTAMIDLIFSDLTIDFNALCNFGGITSAVSNAVYKGQPLASNIAKKQSAADEAIAKFITGWMQE